MKISAWIVVSAGCALGLSGAAFARQAAQPKPADAVKSAQAQMDVVDVAVASGNFKTLAAALKAAGLIDTLKGKGPFTVFAPTDEAFAKLPPGTVESLLKPENKDRLIAVLTYHVVPGAVPASQVVGMKNATTVNGQRVDIMVKDGKVVLDKTATVTKADVKASNGVIHVIDTVILPSDKNIVDTAVAAGSFTTLAKALQAAGLVDALKGKGPFTVFAPTDEAFAKLPPGTLETLLKPENKEKLAAILKYHVVPGAVYADQAAKLDKSPNTLQGTPFSISVKDGQVAIGNSGGMANVVATDIETSNGVIHVIDAVILPK